MKRVPLSETSIGQTVIDGHGNPWTVAQKAEMVTLRNESGRTLELSPERPVNVADDPIPGVDELEVAEYMVAARLGGEKVAVISETGKHYAPKEFQHIGSMLAHLRVVHGLDVSSMPQTMPELKAIHSTDHSERKSGHFIPHFHNNDKFERREA